MSSKINPNLSVFKNVFDKDPKNVTLAWIIEEIRTSYTLQCQCYEIRRQSNIGNIQLLKKNGIKAVTISGEFRGGHASANIVAHSGLLQLDLDAKDFPNGLMLTKVKTIVQNDPYTLVGFVSVSGKGYKAIIRIDPSVETHLLSFIFLENYYRAKYGLIIDPSCKDIGRLCLLSHDPNIYVNYEAKGVIVNHNLW